jgi:predicted O-methyltransferase YrrM
MTNSSRKPIQLGFDGRFFLGGESFVIDISRGARRRPSDSQAFTLVKGEPYLKIYQSLAAEFFPRSILELGVFQGGSYVLLDKLFGPRRMSAVELSPQPVASLMRYVGSMQNRFVHFSTSQSDREALERIIQDELADELDLVVDDASHSYEQTRASFEILFPMLGGNGIYVIEDWSWAHHPDYQSPDSPRTNRKALSNLLFEQIMLMGSTSWIAEVRVWKHLYLIRKGAGRERSVEALVKDASSSIFDRILSRGKKWELI